MLLINRRTLDLHYVQKADCTYVSVIECMYIFLCVRVCLVCVYLCICFEGDMNTDIYKDYPIS